ncbi:MAG: ATP-binding protein [Oscillibacter sp.]|nr:ATP-binding protein [Oscillibacter sp.]
MPQWTPPAVSGGIPHGDMPGDKVEINQGHIDKANTIFPLLVPLAVEAAAQTGRAVVAVCGGSGVGKSETASLLSHYFRSAGVGAYTLSGDNYPRRIPMYNDAERVRIFRVGGMRGMLEAGAYTAVASVELHALWTAETDADPHEAAGRDWLRVYQAEGRKALAEYLGTPAEQDYGELSAIIARFKAGDDTLMLKRMGRTEDERWYEAVDVSQTSVLVIEWTHGNSDFLQGVDIPVLLNSTPEETRAHRRSRARDGKTDSAFTTMVLEIEQAELDSCAHKAKIIISKSGEVLTYDQYRRLMGQEG